MSSTIRSAIQSTSSSSLKRTPLHHLHVELGARFVPFAGYEMPSQFPSGILKEHLHTRAAAGLFDDLMVANRGDHLFLVVNASRKEADEAHLRDGLSDRCIVERMDGRALLALQGPL